MSYLERDREQRIRLLADIESSPPSAKEGRLHISNHSSSDIDKQNMLWYTSHLEVFLEGLEMHRKPEQAGNKAARSRIWADGVHLGMHSNCYSRGPPPTHESLALALAQQSPKH